MSGFISTVFPRRSVTGREWAGRTAFRTHPSDSRARIISRQVISCRRINEVPGRPGSQSAVPFSQHLGSAPEDGVCCHGVGAEPHDAFSLSEKPLHTVRCLRVHKNKNLNLFFPTRIVPVLKKRLHTAFYHYVKYYYLTFLLKAAINQNLVKPEFTQLIQCDIYDFAV